MGEEEVCHECTNKHESKLIKSFQYQNTTISYRIEGNGKPVVLLHGFGENSNIFNHQIEFLKEHCLLIVPDLPGSGKSDCFVPRNDVAQNPISSIKHPVSIEDYAQIIHALLQYENISTYTMFGHSMGGYITLAFAELFTEMLDGFGLIHSTAFADSDEKKLARQKGIELIEQYGSYPFLKNTTPNLFGKKYKEEHPEKIDELIEAGKAFSKKALQQYYAAMMNRKDKTHVLKGSKNPVLFIIGTEDVAVPLNDILKQTILPECSYIHVLEGVGHMSMWEATSQLNKHLLAFIKR